MEEERGARGHREIHLPSSHTPRTQTLMTLWRLPSWLPWTRTSHTHNWNVYIASVVYCLYYYCHEEDCSIAVETVGKNIIIQSCQCRCNNLLAMRISMYLPNQEPQYLSTSGNPQLQVEQWKKREELEATVRSTYRAAILPEFRLWWRYGVYHHGYRGRGQATPTTELYV